MPDQPDPRPAPDAVRIVLRPIYALCLAAFAVASALSAQTLARPGWAGSGLNSDPWWSHAVFYNIRAFDATYPDFKAITVRLDSLQALGVDAILVPPVSHNAPGPDPTLGEFDDLIHKASRDGIRILINLPAENATPDLLATARFWMTHGVAGFRVIMPSGSGLFATQAVVQALRRVTDGAVGQRIVLSDLPVEAASTSFSIIPDRAIRRTVHTPVTDLSTDHAQLQIDIQLARLVPADAAGFRADLAQSLVQPNILMDPAPKAVGASENLAETLAAVALLSHPAALIEAATDLVIPPAVEEAPAPPPPVQAPAPPPPPQALPEGTYAPYVPYVAPVRKTAPTAAVVAKPAAPDRLTEWYRHLGTLHHGSAVLRYGTVVPIDFDDHSTLAWLVRPGSVSNLTLPVIVLCNLSSLPVKLALADQFRKAGLHGNFLHTLLRSDETTGPQDLNGVVLQPYSVYIGELRR